MKKLVAFALAVLLLTSAAPVSAQTTIQKEFNRNNAKLCVAVSLTKTCTKAEYDAAVAAITTANLTAEVKVVLPTGTFYATKEDFRDAEIVSAVLTERSQKDKVEALDAFIRAWRTASGDERVAACTAIKSIAVPEDCR